MCLAAAAASSPSPAEMQSHFHHEELFYQRCFCCLEFFGIYCIGWLHFLNHSNVVIKDLRENCRSLQDFWTWCYFIGSELHFFFFLLHSASNKLSQWYILVNYQCEDVDHVTGISVIINNDLTVLDKKEISGAAYWVVLFCKQACRPLMWSGVEKFGGLDLVLS